jgi:hypothetical protein
MNCIIITDESNDNFISCESESPNNVAFVPSYLNTLRLVSRSTIYIYARKMHERLLYAKVLDGLWQRSKTFISDKELKLTKNYEISSMVYIPV